MTNNTQQIQPGEFYHVYNRAVGNETLFRSHKDYLTWIDTLKKYILPVAEIHAYCLLPNHYHLLIKIKDSTTPEFFSKSMSDAANSYAKFFNLSYDRRGSLFMRPFKRIHIDSNEYLIWCLWYIHRNPMHHGYTENWSEWKYSSYNVYTSGKLSLITTDFMIDIFGSLEILKAHHLLQTNEDLIHKISME
jgi:putative transposase